jgi:hypothetical protein
VAEEPEDALVVATVMPVVLDTIVKAPALPPPDTVPVFPSVDVPNINEELNEWLCPGSVTVDVAVWVWATTIALAEPPVAATA